MGRLRRLDAELVRRKLAPSRTQAARLIAEGRVYVDRQLADKPARQIDPAQAIVVKAGEQADYASRGGHKLAGALDLLGEQGPLVKNRICLDAGASTGGFTDVLLRRGAQRVHAVDVGYGQLRWELQQNPKVVVHDRTNARTITAAQIGEAVTLIVSDLSFISLELVIPALVACATPIAEMLLMVKPQFEIGKEGLGAGGVVRDPADHVRTVSKVIKAAQAAGLELLAVAPSPLPGPAGNVEYFIHLRKQSVTPGESDFQPADSTGMENRNNQGKAAVISQSNLPPAESLSTAPTWQNRLLKQPAIPAADITAVVSEAVSSGPAGRAENPK